MNVGISTASFYPENLLDICDKIGELGFKFIEIFITTESEYTLDFAKILKEKLDYYGIQVVSLHPYTSLLEGVFFFSDYEPRTKDYLKIYTKYFDFGEYLGAKFLTFHGEFTGVSSFSKDKVSRDIQTYKNLSDIANSKNMFLAQENVVKFNSQNLDFLEKLYKNVPNLRYTLDIKQARRANVDVFDYLDVMRDRICNIHANDYDDEKDCKIPGTGIFDYPRFVKKLNDYGYTGDFLIEVYKTNYENQQQLLNSKNFLEKIIY